ncbi:hypothetical protein C1645_820763 [Glomus cerebriforme]|uniref:Uncharacterized protein n=1 Tax=Glomus cerebriforme TaxID=658196 RepID=A0A397TBQ4_9GLOM|nr:hypothetical protein C1645_820763 [Glomus cerebriforme]
MLIHIEYFILVIRVAKGIVHARDLRKSKCVEEHSHEIYAREEDEDEDELSYEANKTNRTDETDRANGMKSMKLMELMATIYTNSQCALDTLQNTKDSLISYSLDRRTIRDTYSLLKFYNYNLLVDIWYFINQKHLDIRFIKIKGHLGNAGNDTADSLTKLDINSELSIDTHSSYYRAHVLYSLVWNGDTPIDFNSHSFLKILHNVSIDAEWASLYYNQDLYDSTYPFAKWFFI